MNPDGQISRHTLNERMLRVQYVTADNMPFVRPVLFETCSVAMCSDVCHVGDRPRTGVVLIETLQIHKNLTCCSHEGGQSDVDCLKRLTGSRWTDCLERLPVVS